MIKNYPTNETPSIDDFTSEFNWTFMENKYLFGGGYYLKREHSPTCFMKPE